MPKDTVGGILLFSDAPYVQKRSARNVESYLVLLVEAGFSFARFWFCKMPPTHAAERRDLPYRPRAPL